MPPLALISSAAICAPPGVAAPAIDCTSAMTPILIGSADCAWAAAVRKIVAAPARRALVPDGCIILSPDIVLYRCFLRCAAANAALAKSMPAVRKLEAPGMVADGVATQVAGGWSRR